VVNSTGYNVSSTRTSRTVFHLPDAGRLKDAALEADARLIAAAPDLLAACKAALSFVGQYGGSAVSLDDPRVDSVLAEAVAKAEGR